MKHFLPVLFCALALLFSSGVTKAQTGGISIVRDVEIESYLYKWSEDVIKAAGLEPSQINLILVQNQGINAFVAGGPNIFMFTGLLEKSDSPLEVTGVIAHELGHISGGHLVRLRESFEDAGYQSLFGALLGAGAAILTGEGQLGTAIALGTQSAAQNNVLAFNRTQETSADQAAISYLKAADINPAGLVSFMGKLESEELLPASQQVEYVRTHPLTRDRIKALKSGLSQSPHKDAAAPQGWDEEHTRMLAKLRGFITPEQVSWQYPDINKDLPSLYAHAIAQYRLNNTDTALGHIEDLLSQEPDNPYFHELKGQVLFESGQVDLAAPSYEQAVMLKPDAAPFRLYWAHALIESGGNDPASLQKAITQLKRAEMDKRTRSPRLHRLMATAYGRLGEHARAALHLAEEALLKGNKSLARQNAKRALTDFDKNSAEYLRASDIIAFLDRKKAEESISSDNLSRERTRPRNTPR